MGEYNLELYHHGVKGQKWGVRRYQNKDGSLTPKGKKHQKIRSDDIVIEKGSIREHVSGQQKLRLDNVETYLYNPKNEHDKSVYQGAYAKYLKLRKGFDEVYIHKYKTTVDLISPSDRHRGELFVEAYKKNPYAYASEMNSVVNYMKVRASNQANLTARNKHISEYNKQFTKDTPTEDLKKYGYDAFNVLGEYGSNRSNAINDYYRYVSKKGYNALIDDNNRAVYNDAAEPIITLNGHKTLKEISTAKLSTLQQQSEELKLRKYMMDNYKKSSIALSDISENESDSLSHHGVKGQKWGVRRYQYADGSLTPLGAKRNKANNLTVGKKYAAAMTMKLSDLGKKAATSITGKQYVDTYLKQGTSFKRIQTSENFENFAFYATYKKADSDKYMGLFGKNLKDRAMKEATKSNDADAIEAAKNMKVYQLSINATKKLKVPSDENASHIITSLMEDKEFKSNLDASIADSKTKMRRPSQQLLFNQAQKALSKDSNKLSSSDKTAIYKAFNLSLTNHNAQEVAAQNKFYSELKKKGYNALLDYNDKEYSSYHAKRPMIVFDLDSVKLNAVTETNPKIVNKMYTKYNADRIAKDSIANTIGLIGKVGSRSVSECRDYANNKIDEYLTKR